MPRWTFLPARALFSASRPAFRAAKLTCGASTRRFRRSCAAFPAAAAPMLRFFPFLRFFPAPAPEIAPDTPYAGLLKPGQRAPALRGVFVRLFACKMRNCPLERPPEPCHARHTERSGAPISPQRVGSLLRWSATSASNDAAPHRSGQFSGAQPGAEPRAVSRPGAAAEECNSPAPAQPGGVQRPWSGTATLQSSARIETATAHQSCSLRSPCEASESAALAASATE